MARLYPLRLEPQVVEKVWGGSWLAQKLGRKGKSGATEKLGESWEAFSGSRIRNGEWQGRLLGDLYKEYGSELGGEAALKYTEFPLLVKFIDARENLSVQVHPDDALARKLENYPFGKSEMWYVMEADPDARVLFSLNDKGVSSADLEAALKNQNILDYLQSLPIKAGDVVNLPARTVHALCEGTVVYELQQESDITYRLYDWGRQGREIHHEKGLQSINLEARNLAIAHPSIPKVQNEAGFARVPLVQSPYFESELVEISGKVEREPNPASFSLLSILEGRGTISSKSMAFEPESLRPGDTLFLPSLLACTINSETPGLPLKAIEAKAR